jgi:hypothetical protein
MSGAESEGDEGYVHVIIIINISIKNELISKNCRKFYHDVLWEAPIRSLAGTVGANPAGRTDVYLL